MPFTARSEVPLLKISFTALSLGLDPVGGARLEQALLFSLMRLLLAWAAYLCAASYAHVVFQAGPTQKTRETHTVQFVRAMLRSLIALKTSNKCALVALVGTTLVGCFEPGD